MRIRWICGSQSGTEHTLFGHRLSFARHAPGVSCWGLDVSCCGRSICFGVRWPPVLYFGQRRGERRRARLCVALHAWRWFGQFRLGESRQRYVDWLDRHAV